MLRHLTIRDFVIVDRLELDFEGGFGALTGETGAGKSILIDALLLALGERADAGVVRAGCERAEVSAEFDLADGSSLTNWLHENDFDAGGGCLLRRVVDAGGRSRAYINGAAATVMQLKTAAEWLADIHGQHAHQSLMRSEAQRRLIDAQAGLSGLANDVAKAYRNWQKIRDARENAESDAEASAKEREMLEWQVRELETLGFDAQQWQDDNQEHRRLAHAAGLIEGSAAAVAMLDGDEQSALLVVDAALNRVRDLIDIDAALKEPADLIQGARIQLDEAVHALNRYRDRLELDPQRLTELEARLQAVMALARKHRVQPEALGEMQASLNERLQDLRLASDPTALAEHEAAAKNEFDALAKKLSAGRRRTASDLSKRVSEVMQHLAMAGGSFDIALEPVKEPAGYGLETIEFRVSANTGQPLRPLAKVASGGELSRIGLAIQVIASQSAQVPTLIFDEVDAGIGGGVAEIVGRMLKQLGKERQVLCVTHLPQVAAQADWQWSVAKETVQDSTLSRLTALDTAARIEELARMLGGVKVTETTRQHAREMLAIRKEK
ncbi:DNA repair protein RecN [Georgfuchsia toluolica]|nr:DNA repair protein RecN [Georgfuchsia toluolica]